MRCCFLFLATYFRYPVCYSVIIESVSWRLLFLICMSFQRAANMVERAESPVTCETEHSPSCGWSLRYKKQVSFLQFNHHTGSARERITGVLARRVGSSPVLTHACIHHMPLTKPCWSYDEPRIRTSPRIQMQLDGLQSS
ncbi:hypothetical protein HDV64DRAFT_58479 [Trichoderma sp. TUCIM 5745]